MERSSVQLLEFYKAYYKWLTTQDETFSRALGLCGNLCNRNLGYDSELIKEMNKQFEQAGLSVLLPFNPDSSYVREVITNTCHENKRRVQWVLDRITDAGE